MAVVDYVPDDTEAYVKWAPHANTRRVYDRNVYSNDTAFVTPPVVDLTGLPARVDSDTVTIFPKKQNAVMVDPTGLDPNKAGIWYTDIIVAEDPDIEPNFIYATLSHPNWPGPETRIVPAGTSKICWSDLAVADPPDPVQVVFVGHPGGVGTPTAPVLELGTVTSTTGSPSVTVVPKDTPGEYILNFVLKQGDPGANGLSAYQQAVANGFVGNMTQWLASLVGAPGAPGISPTVSATASAGAIGVTTDNLGGGAYRFNFTLPGLSTTTTETDQAETITAQWTFDTPPYFPDDSIAPEKIIDFEERVIALFEAGDGISMVRSSDGKKVEISSDAGASVIWAGDAETA